MDTAANTFTIFIPSLFNIILYHYQPSSTIVREEERSAPLLTHAHENGL
jgi:hypothetical protein